MPPVWSRCSNDTANQRERLNDMGMRASPGTILEDLWLQFENSASILIFIKN